MTLIHKTKLFLFCLYGIATPIVAGPITSGGTDHADSGEQIPHNGLIECRSGLDETGIYVSIDATGHQNFYTMVITQIFSNDDSGTQRWRFLATSTESDGWPAIRLRFEDGSFDASNWTIEVIEPCPHNPTTCGGDPFYYFRSPGSLTFRGQRIDLICTRGQ